MEPSAPLDHLTAAMGTSASLAAMFALSLAFAAATAAALVLALRESRRARDAQRAIDGASKLEPGGTLVYGVVETGGDEPAVTVRLFERGREWQDKGAWYHEWKETSREVRARPFHVVTDAKERVLVEPGDDVFLVDDMEVTAQPEALRRERTAALTEGERVAVTGRLRHRHAAGGAYRGSESAWVLEPPARGPMIVSTQPLVARYRSWARFYARVALVPIAFLLATNLVAHYELYTFLLDGRPVVGTVRERDIRETQDRHGTHLSYYLLVGLVGAHVWVEVSSEGYERAAPGSRVAATELPDRRISLGSGPGIHPVVPMWPLGGAVVAGVVVWFYRGRRMLWWEQKRVVTAGRGKLSE